MTNKPLMQYVPGMIIVAVAAVLFEALQPMSTMVALIVAGWLAAVGLASLLDVTLIEFFSLGRALKMGSAIYVALILVIVAMRFV